MTIFAPAYPASSLAVEQGYIKTVDIETGFDSDDFISIALPAFPLASITLASSYVQFTSNPDGNFGVGPTASVAFSESLTTLVAGNSEFRFKRGLIESIDISAITGVRFEIVATGAADFRCLAIRCIHKDWAYAPYDHNTLLKRGVAPVSLNGDPAAAYTFPSDGDDFPILWRSDRPAGNTDPQPIDGGISVGFNTGSSDGTNVMSIFFRERGQDLNTMLDLDGITMEELDGLPQPDYGDARYIGRTQLDLDGIEDSVPGEGIDSGASMDEALTMADLDGRTQFEIERKPDPVNATWVEVRFTWDATDSYIEVFSAESPSAVYTFDPINLSDNLDYEAWIDFDEDTFRVRVFESEKSYLGDLVFDSETTLDPSVFARRRGRLGWKATFEDGDAYVSHIRPRQMDFSEYRSQPFNSITPIAGVQLNVSASGDNDLFKGINANQWGGQISDYPERSPEAFKIRNTADHPLQGIETDPFYLDDFENTSIDFDILVTQEVVDQRAIHIVLWNGSQPINLPRQRIVGNQWTHVSVDLAYLKEDIVPGPFSLLIVQTLEGTANDWYIDTITVNRRNIRWYGRAYIPDAWHEYEGDWIPFRSAINGATDGIVFTKRTQALQVKAQALRQSAYIDSIEMIPKYAELGRLVWGPEDVIDNAAPVADFDTSIDVLTVDFTSTSTDDDYIILSAWAFGDGHSGVGPEVTHTYEEAGTYPVTLTVTDNHGKRTSTTANVTV